MASILQDYLELIQDLKAALKLQDTLPLATKEECKALQFNKFPPTQKAPPTTIFIPKAPERKIEMPLQKEIVDEILVPVKESTKPKHLFPPVYEELVGSIKAHLPGVDALKEIPTDELAQKNAKLWQKLNLDTEVILFYSAENGESEQFFENLTQAISIRLATCKKISLATASAEELKKLLESAAAKLILIDTKSCNSPLFLPLVKKNGAMGQYFLHHIPLFVMESYAQYAKEPLKKKLLWEQLCLALKKSSLPASSST